MPSDLVTVTGDGVCPGRVGGGSLPVHHYLLEVLFSLVPVHRILHSKLVLTRRCSSPGKIMKFFRRVPQI
jgi:hypothetical protein